jgi:hypothetical protein
MKKNISILIIAMLLLSGIGAVAHQYGNQEYRNDTVQQIDLSLSHPVTQFSTETKETTTITLEESNTFLSNSGKPLLPKIVKTFELPFGATNIDVQVSMESFETKQISKPIRASAPLLPLSADYDQTATKTPMMDPSVYGSNQAYPGDWFCYTVGCGINEEYERVTFVTVSLYPVQYQPLSNILTIAEVSDIDISYTEPETNPFPQTATNDLVIIAPDVFSDALQRLIVHKNNLNPPIVTTLKTTEEIYEEFSGIDEAEKIKYFIKHAVEEWGTSYVLLVGGLKSMIYAKPRDNSNIGVTGWYLPVRYTNMYDDPAFPLASGDIFDPGVISDLYYADLYEDGGEFSSWDPNGDGVFAALGKPGVEDDDLLDYYPDVALSRIPCRSIDELNTIIDKIITYETITIDSSWFEKMIVVSGDGFLDQTDLNIQWDTSDANKVPDGQYTIYAQSSNPEGEYSPIISINVTKDRSAESIITYSHKDHLNPAIQDAFKNGFPTIPIAEIVSISEGDVLGGPGSNVAFDPNEEGLGAYCNEFFYWANVSYVDEVLTIRGKSYDPKPYGNLSSIYVWIEDDAGMKVFEDWRNDTEMYYEGEWTTGEKSLLGRGGALYYMPEHFQKEILWASNGKLTGVDDVLSAVSEGSGFLFFSGHGSPNVWADQYPGIPGDRGPSSVTGMQVTSLKPWPPFFSFPLFPMDTLSNGEKLPIAVVGGCHNSQFNVSMILGVYDIFPYLFPSLPEIYMWCHGVPVPQTFSWRLVNNPNGGAIASIGNTGLGYGMPGKELTTGGGDSWITIEFFRQYGEYNQEILGDAYTQTLTSYIDNFDMTDLSAGHPKTISQWVLLGDPSLRIGGYH